MTPMTPSTIVLYVASFTAAGAALVVSFRSSKSLARVCFIAGMVGFALEAIFGEIWITAGSARSAQFWQTAVLLTKSLLPAIWLAFSLTYARGAARTSLSASRFTLSAVLALPLIMTIVFSREVAVISGNLAGPVPLATMAKLLSATLLISNVLILMNLERTIRAAVGTMRWRIKFVFLGLAVIFGTRIYTESETLLFSVNILSLIQLEAAALVIGCLLIGVAYVRRGFSEIDVYPSGAAIRSSITVLVCGIYLLIVGILARVVAKFGGAPAFPLQALILMLGLVGLTALLLSDRIRQRIQLFVSRHFKRPQHDFRVIWTRLTQTTAAVLDERTLCASAARLVSETFNALSVSLWLTDESQECLVRGDHASESVISVRSARMPLVIKSVPPATIGSRPFELDNSTLIWAAPIKAEVIPQFPEGGKILCVPLIAAERSLGIMVVADRVHATPYTVEEMDLLECIGDQVATNLLSIRLAKQLMLAKELEAFQTISAFFVHDLKNAASTLGLMLQNLPVYFDDPAFRDDALRGIGRAAERINGIIARLSNLRHDLQLALGEVELNALFREAIANLNGSPGAEVITDFGVIPLITADRDKLESVMTNLLLNARDAAGPVGKITVETFTEDNAVNFSVADNGCGMSAEFVEKSLFRPFRTTKKKGLGVGMFQAKMIVDAHGGKIHVKSKPDRGTTVRVTLPVRPSSQ
jgi:putative PEP-CTERM system histidine kinase